MSSKLTSYLPQHTHGFDNRCPEQVLDKTNRFYISVSPLFFYRGLS